LHETSEELARWQGKVDQLLDEHERRLASMNGDAKAARQATEKILVEVAIIKTKVAVWSAVGGLIGAGIVSGLMAVFTG
jgi:hypothetical protein